MHREAYFTTGNFGIPAVNSMVSEIGGLLEEHNNAREILEVYTDYNILGILIGSEEMNLAETTRYIENALTAAHDLDNRVLLADALLAASTAMYDFNNLPEAEKYALEALQIRKIPNQLRGTILTVAALTTGDMTLINNALNLSGKENDYPALKLTPDFCFIRKAFILVDAAKYSDALHTLDIAQELAPKNLTRRQCYIQVLQAQCYAGTKEYEQAELIVETAMPMAQDIKSGPNLVRLRSIVNAIKGKS
jgi:tetratricopeptide (TPR) repeat protein